MRSEHQPMETMLTDLADHIDWPDGSVTVRVRQRIVGGRSSDQRLWLRWKVAVAALAVVAVVVAVPAGRQAIADLLGVAGIEVTFTAEAPVNEEYPVDLGRRVSAEELTRSIALPFSLPDLEAVGPPDAIYLQEGGLSIAHATWQSTESLPAAPGTDIGLLLTQFEPASDQMVFFKELTERTRVELTEVRGEPAQWIEGAPHRLTYRTTEGAETHEVSRLAANVLIWERDGVTYRLESTLDLGPARRVAEAVTPVSP